MRDRSVCDYLLIPFYRSYLGMSYVGFLNCDMGLSFPVAFLFYCVSFVV